MSTAAALPWAVVMVADERVQASGEGAEDWIGAQVRRHAPSAILAGEWPEETDVGHHAHQDDFERATCPHAGDFGHAWCGICTAHGVPRWQCGHASTGWPNPASHFAAVGTIPQHGGGRKHR